MSSVGADELTAAFRRAHGRAVATLVRVFGDVALAEDAVQDAFVRAMETWPRDGVPANPAGWIVATARNRAVDVVRRETRGRQLTEEQARDPLRQDRVEPVDEGEAEGVVDDDRLRLVFTCCHPSLRPEHQVALTLRLIAGLTPGEIARAFLVSEATMAKRLTRARTTIRAARIPYRVPTEAELPGRLQAALTVIYLIYNAGADDPARAGLRAEAVRLARELRALMPDEPEVDGLLALVLLNDARLRGRSDADGEVVLLADQDRTRWDPTLIREGQRRVLAALRHPHPGSFALQAAIQAVHCAAPSHGETDWATIVRLYDRLLSRTPTPVVAMNRAIALAETAGPQAALATLQALTPDLDGYHLFHAAQAGMLERLGEDEAASLAYDRAIALAPAAADNALLRRRRAALRREPSAPADAPPG
ncbi:sigma-70 family RNA polymerase sigma factor [Cellulomonas sp. JZ18]|uniref:RNA polymerase sigma factor n=1 Tax=Cellulomonas sp. JZ18 TaxID=2654191 RepID=UPI0012D3F16F|nr:sigma-70 family RNA polymerase sigma factor [Cellulomonas sp. JZ18]QGQ18965.1 sigma-70 family RNA polymerase sigma factor [Cellulomonas sp. JZ18]